VTGGDGGGVKEEEERFDGRVQASDRWTSRLEIWARRAIVNGR
jgi:hypothetical protein